MIVAVEIIAGPEPTAGLLRAAEVLEQACVARGFPVHRLADPAGVDNRLCLYLATADGGYDIEQLLDIGVRRDAFARLGHAQYLVRSWRGQARLHVAMAARNEDALLDAAELVAELVRCKADFTHLDLQGPVALDVE